MAFDLTPNRATGKAVDLAGQEVTPESCYARFKAVHGRQPRDVRIWREEGGPCWLYLGPVD